jgi:membrane fusion protein (multidrug efflux system)
MNQSDNKNDSHVNHPTQAQALSKMPNHISDFKHLPFLMKATIITTTALAVFLAIYWFVWSTRHISTENAYVETDLSPVNSRMMGFVREINVAENDTVKKGQVLLKFDDVDSLLEQTFKKAKYKKAKADFSRAEKLHAQHAMSDSDFEMAQATLAGLSAENEGGDLKLKFTEIIAPTEGIVAKKAAQVGQFVQPGQSLFVIVPIDHMWIKANFKETQVRLLKPKQKVEIKVDAYPGEVWDGEIDFIYPSSVASLSLLPPENATGNFTKVIQRFPVRVSFHQKQEMPLSPGMSVEVVVRVK